MPEPLLTVSGLHTGYGATEILRGVDLTVQDREIVAVLGSNGAGKSTLNRTLSGVFLGAEIGTDRVHDNIQRLIEDAAKGELWQGETPVRLTGSEQTLMRRLADEGAAILFYSSEDSEVLDQTDRCLVFNGGRVVTELSGSRMTALDLTRAAYGEAA